MPTTFSLLRGALRHLSLEPQEQRAALAGMVVTDELALDLDNAVSSLSEAERVAGVKLSPDVCSDLGRLEALLSAGPGDALWADESLDRHPAWAEARVLARDLLTRLPQD